MASTAASHSRYAALRTASGVVAEDPRPLPKELELQALWFAGAFGRDFVTAAGRKVRIVQFGEWNHAAGPDFLHAAIDLDGTIHTGPLEIDTHPGDWEAHGHATNPAFNEVILHVVFAPGSKTHFSRSHDGRDIPAVLVPPELLDDALGRPVTSQAASHHGRCAVPLAELAADRVHDLLAEAARFRLAHKGSQLTHLEDSHGFEEALWQSLARALGYGPNKLAMTLLAQRASRRRLRGLRTNDIREAFLFGLAGFLTAGIHEQCPPDSRRYLGALWNDWWKLRPDHEPDASRALPWTFSGLRPQNHPHRRLGALAAISGDWKKISTPAQKHTPSRLKTLSERLVALEHDFWTRHYTLTAKPSAKPVALFGKARVHEFLANYYLPAWARHDPEAAAHAYRKLPAGTLSDA
ncbi:MAG: DUF2851 family protein, partial [Akkermansiaceae bacterium]|nr:DUF2851 family protein [Akkermansiaceae bacterium]